jgi:hypothetical protein
VVCSPVYLVLPEAAYPPLRAAITHGVEKACEHCGMRPRRNGFRYCGGAVCNLKYPRASRKEHAEVRVARALPRHGTFPTVQTNDGLTPLHVAPSEGHAEVPRDLLGHGADASFRDNDSMTPLHFASQDGRLEVVQPLLDRGEHASALSIETGHDGFELIPSLVNDNSYTPSGPSSLTSARGALHHKSSKESICSHQTSLSNFSTHSAPSAVYKDRGDLSGQDRRPHTSRHCASDLSRDENFSVSDLNYSDALQKSYSSLQNESQSNVSATPGVEPGRRSPCASAFLRVLTFLSHITMFGSVTCTTFMWTSRVSFDRGFLTSPRLSHLTSSSP